jgi:hypothetical protein
VWDFAHSNRAARYQKINAFLYFANPTGVLYMHGIAVLINEIDAEEMEDQAAKDVVGESPIIEVSQWSLMLLRDIGMVHTSLEKWTRTPPCSLQSFVSVGKL